MDKYGNANPLKWQSKKISRVVKSTLAAETLALLEAAETAYYLKRLWESIICTKSNIKIICFCDNKSIVEHIDTSTNKVADYRLRVDISCLRDMLVRGEIEKIYWIDTKQQLADCLTKANASCNALVTTLRNNYINVPALINTSNRALKRC